MFEVLESLAWRCGTLRTQQSATQYFLALGKPDCYPSGVLPIVRRELQVVASKRGVFWQRMIIGGIAAFVAISFMFFSRSQASGSAMFKLLSWGVFYITLLDGIRCAADSISWERREGTLGLLFLTDLRSFDIVFAKFSTAAIQALTTLLVTFPILALPLMMGGVTPLEWIRTIATLAVTILFSLSVSLCFSAISVHALASMAGAALFLGFFVLPEILFAMLGLREWAWLSGPFSMLRYSEAGNFFSKPATFWLAMVFSLFLSLLMFIAACGLIGRRGSFDSRTKRDTWWRRFLEPKPRLAQTFSEGGFADAPGLWLANRTLPGKRLLWGLTIAGAILGFAMVSLGKPSTAVGALISIQLTMGLLVKLWIGVVAPQSLHTARSSGALELLLCTPIRPDNLVRGQLEALRKYIFPPALLVSIGYPLVGMAGAVFAGQDFQKIDGLWIVFVSGLFWFGFFLLDYFALAYTGLWFALSCPRIEQAVGRTVGYVLILPILALIVPFIGWMVFLVWPIFWICWSSQKVQFRFTEQAAEQFVRPSA